MKRLHFFGVASLVSVGLLGVLAACTSEDTIVTADDAGFPDSNVPDVEEQPDAGEPDAPGPDIDAGLTVDNYDDAVAEKLCNALTKCCFGNADVEQDAGVDGGDAGSGYFDRAACLNIYGTLGFESSNRGLKAAAPANVGINQAKGVECMEKIDALACNLDGASLKAIRSACFGALQGKLAAGQPCVNSMECRSGTFCDPTATDGGVADGGPIGVCTALRAQGENCSIQVTGDPNVDSSESEIACSTRGGGDTGKACQSYDPDTAPYDYKADRGDWTCQPAVANGKGCNSTVSCADGICDPSVFECKPVLTYFNRFACKQHLR